MEADDWRAVGEIIALGWILYKILPIRLAPNFLKSSLFGFGSDKLRGEFLQFIPNSESVILSNAVGYMENELVWDVDSEFQKITPTSKKLLSTLKSFKYLKRYIRAIEDTKMLRTLHRFITASDLMLYNSEGKIFHNSSKNR